MSSIIDPTTPASSSNFLNEGLEIIGLLDQVNRLVATGRGDSISGGNLDDIISGGGGNDTIDGLDGSDRLLGDGGNDRLRDSTGNNILDGGEGDDSLAGGTDNDELLGRDGNDTLNDLLGNNTLDGGAGDDRIIVSDGANILTGGTGRDTFHFKLSEDPSPEINEITDFQVGEDRIIIQSAAENPSASYDTATGKLSVDGKEIVQLDTDLNIDVNDVEFIGVEPADSEGATVYRFLNSNTNAHLYTTSEAEREAIETDLPEYNFEGESYLAVDPLTGTPEPKPVYRFFNQDTGVHLYTISEVEKTSILKNAPNFSFEGEAFYAYDTQIEGTVPVYRFFEPTIGAHLYTSSEIENEFIEQNLPNYSAEGIAYYVFEFQSLGADSDVV
ncbi:hypothetical protein I4641_06550 [Waterburya agarophytonicola K14]|uniref:DUF5648 domain-containing protein n=1 Tax=Waterburya agarophytonicola KI4 TaxID=2874699 RepID=A0A964FF50_9CYAN|nr:hypothetical protein [Waterburya agarophytonicola]MCC0176637.1 hypothetical protein [Waterburya agarophytonicola KI4]